MIDHLADAYLWFKALHIIAAISWMVGLLYLPRLFVYHCDVQNDPVHSKLFQAMERRLLRAIMIPAMLATWVFGAVLLMVSPVVDWGDGWLHLKLVLVLLMTLFHVCLSRWSICGYGYNLKSPTWWLERCISLQHTTRK